MALGVCPDGIWVVQLDVPDGAVSSGMPITTAPGSVVGVTSFQVPAVPADDERMTGAPAVAPTAAQVALPAVGGLSHETPMKYWTESPAGRVAKFHAQLPLVSDPLSSCPVAEAAEVTAVTAQSAASPGAGLPQATDPTVATVVGMPLAWTQLWVALVRSPVHTAGALGAVPMATQVVVVHDRAVTDEAPVGNVDSLVHELGPLPATATVMTVASLAVD